MALFMTFTTSADIPEALREHYVEKDGRWVLQTDPPADDVTGLKTALESERRLRRDAESQSSSLKSRFEGITPEEVASLRDTVKNLKDKDIYDKDGLEALIARRTQEMRSDFQRKLTAAEREVAQTTQRHADLDRTWRRDRVETALLHAITVAGVAKQAVPDAVSRGLTLFLDIDDQGRPVAKKGEEVLYDKDGINPLSPDEWIVGLKLAAPHLWPSSTGSGASHGANNQGTGVDYSKLSPTERLTRYREEKAGQTG